MLALTTNTFELLRQQSLAQLRDPDATTPHASCDLVLRGHFAGLLASARPGEEPWSQLNDAANALEALRRPERTAVTLGRIALRLCWVSSGDREGAVACLPWLRPYHNKDGDQTERSPYAMIDDDFDRAVKSVGGSDHRVIIPGEPLLPIRGILAEWRTGTFDNPTIRRLIIALSLKGPSDLDLGVTAAIGQPGTELRSPLGLRTDLVLLQTDSPIA